MAANSSYPGCKGVPALPPDPCTFPSGSHCTCNSCHGLNAGLAVEKIKRKAHRMMAAMPQNEEAAAGQGAGGRSRASNTAGAQAEAAGGAEGAAPKRRRVSSPPPPAQPRQAAQQIPLVPPPAPLPPPVEHGQFASAVQTQQQAQQRAEEAPRGGGALGPHRAADGRHNQGLTRSEPHPRLADNQGPMKPAAAGNQGEGRLQGAPVSIKQEPRSSPGPAAAAGARGVAGGNAVGPSRPGEQGAAGRQQPLNDTTCAQNHHRYGRGYQGGYSREQDYYHSGRRSSSQYHHQPAHCSEGHGGRHLRGGRPVGGRYGRSAGAGGAATSQTSRGADREALRNQMRSVDSRPH